VRNYSKAVRQVRDTTTKAPPKVGKGLGPGEATDGY